MRGPHGAVAGTELAALDLRGGPPGVSIGVHHCVWRVRLLDEAIHVAATLHLAGFADVVGTLWPVSDGAAMEFADHAYAALTASTGPAAAVHHATMRLRQRYLSAPQLWASHIHIGA